MKHSIPTSTLFLLLKKYLNSFPCFYNPHPNTTILHLCILGIVGSRLNKTSSHKNLWNAGNIAWVVCKGTWEGFCLKTTIDCLGRKRPQSKLGVLAWLLVLLPWAGLLTLLMIHPSAGWIDIRNSTWLQPEQVQTILFQVWTRHWKTQKTQQTKLQHYINTSNSMDNFSQRKDKLNIYEGSLLGKRNEVRELLGEGGFGSVAKFCNERRWTT